MAFLGLCDRQEAREDPDIGTINQLPGRAKITGPLVSSNVGKTPAMLQQFTLEGEFSYLSTFLCVNRGRLEAAPTDAWL